MCFFVKGKSYCNVVSYVLAGSVWVTFELVLLVCVLWLTSKPRLGYN